MTLPYRRIYVKKYRSLTEKEINVQNKTKTTPKIKQGNEVLFPTTDEMRRINGMLLCGSGS
jgi:hypothetical protein